MSFRPTSPTLRECLTVVWQAVEAAHFPPEDMPRVEDVSVKILDQPPTNEMLGCFMYMTQLLPDSPHLEKLHGLLGLIMAIQLDEMLGGGVLEFTEEAVTLQVERTARFFRKSGDIS
ncbi:MAG: hypothetical protein AAB558_04970 [Patescibacteria group bacterium]